jgi:hypothetical protein
MHRARSEEEICEQSRTHSPVRAALTRQASTIEQPASAVCQGPWLQARPAPHEHHGCRWEARRCTTPAPLLWAGLGLLLPTGGLDSQCQSVLLAQAPTLQAAAPTAAAPAAADDGLGSPRALAAAAARCRELPAGLLAGSVARWPARSRRPAAHRRRRWRPPACSAGRASH